MRLKQRNLPICLVWLHGIESSLIRYVSHCALPLLPTGISLSAYLLKVRMAHTGKPTTRVGGIIDRAGSAVGYEEFE